MQNNKHIQEIIALNNAHLDRAILHKKVGETLPKIAADKNFWVELFKKNLSDKGFLQRSWSMYEIPFFYVYENEDFNLKVHLFVALEGYANNIAASAIHHHNNYLLTTLAAYGSGYETFLFEKDFEVNPETKHVNLKIREHFTQQQRPVHTVNAWEPHVVINPVSFSATLNFWTPDKKRATDNLRTNPVLKAFKMPLRKLIYLLGMENKFGIAAKETYQFYTQNNKFHAVLEDDFFAPTRAQVGSEVDNYSVQTIFRFMQKMNFEDYDFIASLKTNNDVPVYYHKWIDMFVNKQEIPETFAKAQINIPGGVMTIEDIKAANGNS